MKYELTIPESLKDITLEQYQTYLLIEEPTDEDLLTVFLNEPIEVINQIKATEVDKMVIHINSLFEQEQKHSLKFNLNGTPLGFIPDLDSITYGENKDITTYINDWKTMHNAMAVLYRPIELTRGGKYIIKEYEGTRNTAEKMRQMPLGIVMGSILFFYNLTNELLKAIPNFIHRELARTNSKVSAKNGAAIKKSLRLLKTELDELLALQQTFLFQNTPSIHA